MGVEKGNFRGDLKANNKIGKVVRFADTQLGFFRGSKEGGTVDGWDEDGRRGQPTLLRLYFCPEMPLAAALLGVTSPFAVRRAHCWREATWVGRACVLGGTWPRRHKGRSGRDGILLRHLIGRLETPQAG